MGQKMPHWLTKQASMTPNGIALETTNGETITFQGLQEKSEQFAKRLYTKGVRRQDRVALLSTNSVDMVIAVHALSYLEAVIVMLNVKLSPYELQYQLDTAGAKFMLTSDSMQESTSLQVEQQAAFADINGLNEAPVDVAQQIDLATPFTMMFTSGTTGKPKAVVHTYGNHWWSAIGSALNLGLDKADKWLLVLPIFHVGGLSILLRSVIYGITVYIQPKYDAQQFHDIINTKRITIVSLVTLMLRDFLEALGESELPDHVRCLLLGGGAVPEPLLEKVSVKQLPLFQSYGMTETSSQIVTLSANDALDKIGSSGKPLFPASLKILEPQKDGIGEIAVQGPMVMRGYDQNEAANKASFENGWFKTGDLGYTDSEGFLYVVERRTDLIISGGENIYPSEIENVLLDMVGIREAAVVGRHDSKWGQVPIAFIVTKDVVLSEQEIMGQAKERLASYKVPKKVYSIDALPRNASNKIMRHQLQEKLTER